MSFKKLLLSTAIAAASTTSFAMEAMDDTSMSETTGQDGLTVIITPPNAGIGADIWLHDRDGLVGFTNPGAIVIDGFLLDLNGVNSTTTTSAISVLIDATGDGNTGTAGSQPMLNIGVTLPASTTITTGTILVGASTASSFGVTPTAQETVLSSMNINLVGQTSFNIQLGAAEEQGAMIKFSTSITSGIVINNFALEDATSGGSINAVRVAIDDNGAGANLSTVVNVDAASNGLLLTLTSLGSATGLDIAMTDVGLGNTTSIGDVEVVGLNLNGTTIRILGH